MDFLLKHKLMAGGIVILVAAAAWYFLAGSFGSEAVLDVETPSVPPQAQQLIDSLAALSSVSLDGAIFSNPSFQALADFSTPIVVEPVGRDNPFLPLSAREIGNSTPPPTSKPSSPKTQ